MGLQDAAWHDTMWSAPRGHLLESQADLVVRHPADHLLERGEGEQPGPEMHRAHLERLRNQQRCGHGQLAVAMPNFQVSWAECRPQIELLPYLRTGTARPSSELGRSDGLPPVRDPGLRPGFFGSRFGSSVRLGACQRAVIEHALELGNPGVPFLQLTLEIRVLHVQSTQLALKPFNPFAQFANRLPPGPEHAL